MFEEFNYTCVIFHSYEKKEKLLEVTTCDEKQKMFAVDVALNPSIATCVYCLFVFIQNTISVKKINIRILFLNIEILLE